MAYDRYEGRGDQRGWRDDDRQRGYGRGGEHNERGFFERAKEEVASWFGDEDSERRRMQDDRMNHPDSSRYEGGRGRQGHDHDRGSYGERGGMFGGGQSSSYGRGREQDYRNQYGRGGGESGGFGGGDYQGQNRQSWMDRDDDDHRSSGRYPGTLGQSHGSHSPRESGRDYERSDYGRSSYGREQDQGHGYRPMTGDYGRSGGGRDEDRYRSGMGSQDFNRSQYGRQEFSQDQANDRGSSGQRYNYGGWGDDDSRRQSQGRGGYSGSSFGGSNTGSSYGAGNFGGGRHHDEHYSSWRQRQIEELDRDYDDYRREHQSKFESEFGGWRQQKQTKRQMLQSIQEHAEVVDQNGEHIGTVDKVRGDTIILTRNDPEAGGVHRSFTCTLLERVEGGKVYLSGTKDSIRSQLRTEDDNRDRDRSSGSSGGGIFSGLFGGGRDNDRQESSSSSSTTSSSTGEGPHVLDRSFSGTYDDDKKS